MAKSTNKRADTLKGATKLTVQSLTELTDFVESIHAQLTPFSTVDKSQKIIRKKGISGFVYRIIRKITHWVGVGLHATIHHAEPLLGEHKPSFKREASLAALNGVVGDYLEKEGNDLAIAMQFRKNGEPISAELLKEELIKSDGKVLICIHGLCMNDLQWTYKNHNHGEQLASELGLAVIYLKYNSGLHISENGKKFNQLLIELCEQFPEVKSISILGHSMGGLVTRSACYYGGSEESTWLKLVDKVIYLGTPHHGAPLERGGHWLETMLELFPYTAPFSKLGQIRSAGIMDLRYGFITDSDWFGKEPADFSELTKHFIPLHKNLQHFAITTTLGKAKSKTLNEKMGDGLVPLDSGLGIHQNPAFSLQFSQENVWFTDGIHHLDLLANQAIYAKLKEWLA